MWFWMNLLFSRPKYGFLYKIWTSSFYVNQHKGFPATPTSSMNQWDRNFDTCCFPQSIESAQISVDDNRRPHRGYSSVCREGVLLKRMKSYAFKMGRVAARPVLLLYYVMRSEETPVKDKLTIFGALAYIILPIDLRCRRWAVSTSSQLSPHLPRRKRRRAVFRGTVPRRTLFPRVMASLASPRRRCLFFLDGDR